MKTKNTLTLQILNDIADIELHDKNMSDDFPCIPKASFRQLVLNYLNKRTEKRADTIFMRRKTYDNVIRACRNNKDTDFATAVARHHWRRTFELQELGSSENPLTQVIRKSRQRIMIPLDRIYDLICKLHVGVGKHCGQRALRDMVS